MLISATLPIGPMPLQVLFYGVTKPAFHRGSPAALHPARYAGTAPGPTCGTHSEFHVSCHFWPDPFSSRSGLFFVLRANRPRRIHRERDIRRLRAPRPESGVLSPSDQPGDVHDGLI